MPMSSRVINRVIIDCDPGIDDAAAIFLALASPELEVAALSTVFGNGPVEASTGNAHRILEAAGRSDIPVFTGAARPLLREPTAGWASHIHGDDALGGPYVPHASSVAPGDDRHAALAILGLANANPGELSIIALGRLTNIALALALQPALAAAVQRIVVMGGAVNVPGNVSAFASANLYEDPEAAAMVYRSGAAIVQVGLDVCNQVTVSADQLEAIAASPTPPAQLLSRAAGFLRRSYEDRGLLSPGEGVRFNDMPAVGYAVDPGLFTTTPARVEIETRSEEGRGRTVADWSAPNPNALVCTGVDSAALTELFTRRLAQRPG